MPAWLRMTRKYVLALGAVFALVFSGFQVAQASSGSGSAARNTDAATPAAPASPAISQTFDTGWCVANGHTSVGSSVCTRARGIFSSKHLGTGAYEVIFNSNVRSCVYVATVGLPGSSGVETPGQISTVGRATNVNGVFISTQDSAGNFSDRSFHLLVAC